MKKTLLITTMLAALAVGGLTGCNKAKADFNIGVCQLVKHDALDAATKGFMDTVRDGMAAAGKSVDFDVQLASGESDKCAVISNSFASKKKDLILANATPALQAAVNSTETIPILGTSITEYGVALGIDNFSGKTGINVSGTSDLAPLEEQAQMLVDNFPGVSTVGILYCSGEANSLYQVNVVERKLQNLGKTVRRISFADTNTLSVALSGTIDQVDALYIPTDNKCASSAEIIDSICSNKNKPVFAGEEGICKGCGAFTLSISYYNIGVATGNMALEILLNKADIKTMDIRYDEHPVKKYNPTICTRLGLTVPSDYVAIE